MSFLALALDVVIIGLLAATIVYAVLLNRQIIRLRDSRGELQTLIKGFNEATARAEAGVKGMKRAAGEAGEGLQKAIDRAQLLRDELQLIIETGDALATRLEGAASERTRSLVSAAPARSQGVAKRTGDPGPMASTPPEPVSRRQRAVVAEDGEARRGGGGAKGSAEDMEGLSKAERELLKAIESRR